MVLVFWNLHVVCEGTIIGIMERPSHVEHVQKNAKGSLDLCIYKRNQSHIWLLGKKCWKQLSKASFGNKYLKVKFK